MTPWNSTPEQDDACAHYVQFYKADEPLLNRNVGNYLWEGYLRGQALIVVATPARHESLRACLHRLGVDVASAIAEGQLVLIEAGEMLATFMVAGRPDRALFEKSLDEAMRLARPRDMGAGVRIYGEMVGVLWQAGECAAAIQLEEYWNRTLHVSGITLFCGYPIDVFGRDLENAHIEAIVRAHSHPLPDGMDGGVGEAVIRAMQEVLGDEAEGLKIAMNAAPARMRPAAMPAGESTILWLRKNIPDFAEGILSKARGYYESTAQAATA